MFYSFRKEIRYDLGHVSHRINDFWDIKYFIYISRRFSKLNSYKLANTNFNNIDLYKIRTKIRILLFEHIPFLEPFHINSNIMP